MKKYAVIYGSLTGKTADVARRIGALLDVDNADILNVKDVSPSMLGKYETLILGTSTWGAGELERDWYDLLDGIESLDLKDKKIAIFGCGDEKMKKTFCNGVGELYQRLGKTGAKFIAPFNADGYTFEESAAKIDGQFVGLVLDEVNHPELTPEKLVAWTDEIKKS